MTSTLGWQVISDRESWRDEVDTQHLIADERFTDLRENTASWSEEIFAEDRSAEMIEDLPRSLVDGYVERACRHAVSQEVDPGVWFASVAGLDGAYGDGDSPEAACSELREALVGWVAVKRRLGQEIPVLEGLDLNLPRRSAA
jgi:predicted RNase H-like HicB family nuclease